MKKFTVISFLSVFALLSTASVANAACKCPSGYKTIAGASVGSSSAKVCEKKYTKTTSRKASCDVGWVLQRDVHGKKDICMSTWGQEGDYTVPKGTSGIAGKPTKFGWRLTTKKGRDVWKKSERKSKIRACIG